MLYSKFAGRGGLTHGGRLAGYSCRSRSPLALSSSAYRSTFKLVAAPPASPFYRDLRPLPTLGSFAGYASQSREKSSRHAFSASNPLTNESG